MTKPTIAAGYPKAFLDFAVSRGADRQALIERGRKQVATFSWKRMAEQTLAVYKEVLKEN